MCGLVNVSTSEWSGSFNNRKHNFLSYVILTLQGLNLFPTLLSASIDFGNTGTGP